jgi:hypothetical protein
LARLVLLWRAVNGIYEVYLPLCFSMRLLPLSILYTQGLSQLNVGGKNLSVRFGGAETLPEPSSQPQAPQAAPSAAQVAQAQAAINSAAAAVATNGTGSSAQAGSKASTAAPAAAAAGGAHATGSAGTAGGGGSAPSSGSGGPTCVVRLSHMITRDDILDPQEYQEIKNDVEVGRKLSTARHDAWVGLASHMRLMYLCACEERLQTLITCLFVSHSPD